MHIKDTIQCLRLKPDRIYGMDLPRLYRLHRHIAMDEPHMGNATEMEAMLGNMCFDIMLASFHLGYFYVQGTQGYKYQGFVPIP
jgi:hypothetical protein